MRVVRIITRLNIGGPSIQAITLSERLTARGFETLLVHGRLGEAEGDMQYLPSKSVERRYVPSLRRAVAPRHDLWAVAKIFHILREFRPQIIHTHTAKAGTLGRLAATLYNRTAGRHARARIVHTYHGHVLEGYFGSPAATFFTLMERRLAHATDAIVAISPEVRRHLLEQFRIGCAAQYHVVPLGFDLARFTAIDDQARWAARAALAIPADAHVVSTVGRLTAVKAHRLFLDTASRVAARDPRALFLIAGDGELRPALESAARALGIGERTRFLGWRRDLDTIYGASDVLLLTSRNEGTPVALIESLAAAVPGVSTDVGGVQDVLDTEEVGLLAPFGDADRLADHVSTLLAEPVRRRAMGERGRDAVRGRYSLDRLVADIVSLYAELLDRPAAP